LIPALICAPTIFRPWGVPARWTAGTSAGGTEGRQPVPRAAHGGARACVQAHRAGIARVQAQIVRF